MFAKSKHPSIFRFGVDDEEEKKVELLCDQFCFLELAKKNRSLSEAELVLMLQTFLSSSGAKESRVFVQRKILPALSKAGSKILDLEGGA